MPRRGRYRRGARHAPLQMEYADLEISSASLEIVAHLRTRGSRFGQSVRRKGPGLPPIISKTGSAKDHHRCKKEYTEVGRERHHAGVTRVVERALGKRAAVAFTHLP